MKINITSAVAIVVLLVLIGIQYFKINGLERDRTLQAVELSTLKDSVEMYIAANGELTGKIESVEVEKGDLKKSLALLDIEVKDLKADNIKWKRLTNVLQLQLQSAGSGESNAVNTFYVEVPVNDSTPSDTIKYLKIDDWTNNSLSLFNQKVQNKKFTFDYTYDVRTKMFIEGTRKKPIVTVTLDDTNAKIVTANSITVPHKTKWYEKPWVWGLAGLTSGYLISK